MSYTTGGKPGIKAQETTLTGRDMTIFQTLDDYIGSTSVAGYALDYSDLCTAQRSSHEIPE